MTFQLTIKWHLGGDILPKCYAWVRGQTPIEFDGLLCTENIEPEDGELTSEELARRLEKLAEESALQNNKGEVVEKMAAYTANQLRALANQIRRATSKVEVFAYNKLVNPTLPWQHATDLNATECPWGNRSDSYIFRGDWTTKDGQTHELRLWLTPIPAVKV